MAGDELKLKREKVSEESFKSRLSDWEKHLVSENGAYTAAKFELGSIGRQLRQIKYILANAYIPVIKMDDKASFGKTITLKNDKNTLTFTLVGQYESDVTENKYSLESPIGQAVIGKKVGDEIIIVSPKGKTTYILKSIK